MTRAGNFAVARRPRRRTSSVVQSRLIVSRRGGMGVQVKGPVDFAFRPPANAPNEMPKALPLFLGFSVGGGWCRI